MTHAVFTRRRVLQIAAAVPLAGLGATARAAAPVAQWHGVALGAQSQILIAGLDAQEAAPVFATVQDEIARLEAVFSLYQSRSELSRLNATGGLADPSPDLLTVLSLSRAVWTASLGAFDPSIQPLWQARAAGVEPPLLGHDLGSLRLSANRVSLAPGMALTLNGIAQGYITDKVAKLLRDQGLTDVIVNAGEQYAMGARPDGTPWQVGISDPADGLVSQVSLTDRALATSSIQGTLLNEDQGHIIDARTGLSATQWSTISMLHDSAAVADALSTAACCLTTEETADMLTHFADAQIAYRA
ncbi:FAD:protein FMN transferase [Marivita sp. S6314]|uniref:FAD:protein FMN transferase n=1 Tax=Marivita sp. S6314 TaxID=2926406 RepID=UPI001FF2DD77|nr:FAD:protein FMN transferase [Marivita sp. S6314]MCK0150462.1 FAD:protein FMN transferase [Marivita sp. S6314]